MHMLNSAMVTYPGTVKVLALLCSHLDSIAIPLAKSIQEADSWTVLRRTPNVWELLHSRAATSSWLVFALCLVHLRTAVPTESL